MELKHPLLFKFITILLMGCTPETLPPQSIGPLRDTTIYNISYGTDASQKIDLGLPANRNASTPFIVVVHGGGWIAGEIDRVVNPGQSTSMVYTLGTLGVDKKIISYPLTFHDWWTDCTKTSNTLDELKA